jgi:hypothetical protein
VRHGFLRAISRRRQRREREDGVDPTRSRTPKYGAMNSGARSPSLIVIFARPAAGSRPRGNETSWLPQGTRDCMAES